MRNATKSFIFSFLLLTLTSSSALAQTETSWFQKIKNFFTGSPAPETTAPARPTASETPSAETESSKPVFDFSEKTVGNREAPLKIHIFTSLTCPHCPVVHTQLMPYIQEKYVDKNEALIILEDFPLDTRAVTASLISRCLSGEQYFAFMESLFENQMKWAVAPNLQEALLPYAKLAGLTEDEMTACATDESALKELTRQRNLAIMQFKIHATPTLILQLGKEKEFLEGVPSRSDLDRAIERLKKTYKGSWPAAPARQETAPAPTAP